MVWATSHFLESDKALALPPWASHPPPDASTPSPADAAAPHYHNQQQQGQQGQGRYAEVTEKMLTVRDILVSAVDVYCIPG